MISHNHLSLEEFSPRYLTIRWLKHEYERALLNVNLGLDIGGQILIKTFVVGDLPLTEVQGVEVITPFKLKATCSRVPLMVLNPVASGKPRHGRIISAGTPVFSVSI